jgi:hypothetical protein
MKVVTVILCLLLATISCEEEAPEVTCNENIFNTNLNYNYQAMLKGLPANVVTGLTKNPTAEGAMGRNKEGYFHVRFQLDLGFLAAYAIKFESEDALEKFILACEYSYAHQKNTGDFELIIPDNLKSLGTPSEGDLASGTSFFLATMGSSLIALQQSDWFNNKVQNSIKLRLDEIKGNIQLSLDYLKTKKELLISYDNDAPNRLFFDAMAFYSLGKYLNDEQAKTIGTEFINLALSKQNKEGYFIEAGGFDSSYNGVSLRLGMMLLGILSDNDTILPLLKKSLSCCVEWQASRVLSTGEISTLGNTRVFPGGEVFLGEAKEMAWIDTTLAFYFTLTLSNQNTFSALSAKIESFYR